MDRTSKLFRPNIIDIEASGFGYNSYPIEVGVILTSGNSYCSLIYPASDWCYWDDKAESVHGISRDMLFEYGKPVETVTNELNEFLSDQTVYSDGWVIDKPWITKLFLESSTKPKFHISALEWILNEPQMAVWSTTKAKVINDLALTRHRASADARIIQETFARTKLAV